MFGLSFVIISTIVVICVAAPLFLLGFILRSALAVKPPRSSDDKPAEKKNAP